MTGVQTCALPICAEPYFSAAASINLAKMMREIGFVDVEEYALEKRGYPWVTRGRKPS